MIIIDDMRQKIKAIAQKHGLALVALFGSEARGDVHKGSDIDIAYSSKTPMELSEECKMAVELHDAFRTTRVDLVNIGKASPLLLKKIMDDGVALYEARESLFNNLYLYAMNIYRESLPLNELRRQYVLRRMEEFKKEIAHAR